jgi:hypothetical protein
MKNGKINAKNPLFDNNILHFSAFLQRKSGDCSPLIISFLLVFVCTQQISSLNFVYSFARVFDAGDYEHEGANQLLLTKNKPRIC